MWRMSGLTSKTGDASIQLNSHYSAPIKNSLLYKERFDNRLISGIRQVQAGFHQFNFLLTDRIMQGGKLPVRKSKKALFS